MQSVEVQSAIGSYLATSMVDVAELTSAGLQQDSEVPATPPRSWTAVQAVGEIPVTVSGHAAVVFGRMMYCIGGFNAGKVHSHVHGFDLDTNTWTLFETNGESPPARTSHSVVLDSDRGLIYMLAGSGADFGHSNLGDCWRYDIVYRTWTKLEFSGAVPEPRYGQSVVFYNNKLVMFGGTFGIQFSNDVFVYDLDTLECKRIMPKGTPNEPSARYKHSACVFGYHMLVFGGADDQSHKLRDLYAFDMEAYTWHKLSYTGEVAGRFAHCACVHNRQMYISSGTDLESIFSDLAVLDLNSLHWSSVQTIDNPPPRYFHTGAVDPMSEKLYLFGGKGSNTRQFRLNDLHSISISPDRSVCSLAADMAALLERNHMCDVNIVCGDGTVLGAHSPILRVRCALLFKMRRPARDEFGIDNQASAVIRLSFTGPVVRAFLEFLYTDELAALRLSSDFYVRIMVCASQFGLPRLQKLCEQRIKMLITCDEASKVLQEYGSVKLGPLAPFMARLIDRTLAARQTAAGPAGPAEPATQSLDSVPIAGMPALADDMEDDLNEPEEETDAVPVAGLAPVPGDEDLDSDLDGDTCSSFSGDVSTADSSSSASTSMMSVDSFDPFRIKSGSMFTVFDEEEKDACKQSLADYVLGSHVPTIPESTLAADLLRLRTDSALLTDCPFDYEFLLWDDAGNLAAKVPAHLAILMARSHFFGSYSFLSGMREATQGFCDMPASHISPQSFAAIIAYMYGGMLYLDVSLAAETGDSDGLNTLRKQAKMPPLAGLGTDAAESGCMKLPNLVLLTNVSALELLNADASNYYGLSTPLLDEWLPFFIDAVQLSFRSRVERMVAQSSAEQEQACIIC